MCVLWNESKKLNILEIDNLRCLIRKRIKFNNRKSSKKDSIVRVQEVINIFRASDLCLITMLRRKIEFNRVCIFFESKKLNILEIDNSRYL